MVVHFYLIALRAAVNKLLSLDLIRISCCTYMYSKVCDLLHKVREVPLTFPECDYVQSTLLSAPYRSV